MDLLSTLIGGACTLFAAFCVFLWAQWADTHRRRRLQIIEACERIMVTMHTSNRNLLLATTIANCCADDPEWTLSGEFDTDAEKLRFESMYSHEEEPYRISFAHAMDDMRDEFLTLKRVSKALLHLSVEVAQDAKKLGLYRKSNPYRGNIECDSNSAEDLRALRVKNTTLRRWIPDYILMYSHLRTEMRFIQRKCTQELEITFWERMRLHLLDTSSITKAHGPNKDVLAAMKRISAMGECDADTEPADTQTV